MLCFSVCDPYKMNPTWHCTLPVISLKLFETEKSKTLCFDTQFLVNTSQWGITPIADSVMCMPVTVDFAT